MNAADLPPKYQGQAAPQIYKAQSPEIILDADGIAVRLAHAILSQHASAYHSAAATQHAARAKVVLMAALAIKPILDGEKNAQNRY